MKFDECFFKLVKINRISALENRGRDAVGCAKREHNIFICLLIGVNFFAFINNYAGTVDAFNIGVGVFDIGKAQIV